MRQVTRRGTQKKDYEYSLIVDGNNLLKISLVDSTMNAYGKEYGGVMTFLTI